MQLFKCEKHCAAMDEIEKLYSNSGGSKKKKKNRNIEINHSELLSAKERHVLKLILIHYIIPRNTEKKIIPDEVKKCEGIPEFTFKLK